MEDSAMVIRGKFMGPPGEQFFIRRAVYRRVEAFRANGLEFATARWWCACRPTATRARPRPPRPR